MEKTDDIERYLTGRDQRSLGRSGALLKKITNQKSFNELFKLLFHSNRLIAMRAADVIEKITIHNYHYLDKHKPALLNMSEQSTPIEIKWHLALLLTRISLYKTEFDYVWETLTRWALNQSGSMIVRVNSVQGLYNLCLREPSRFREFKHILTDLQHENIPSINARIRNLKKQDWPS